MMSSFEFEVAAKCAVIDVLKDLHEEEYTLNDIQAVWFSHILGSKKVILIDLSKNQRIYEVTYNASTEEFYIDIYDKESNTLMKRNRVEEKVAKYTKQDKPNYALLVKKLDILADSDSLSDKYKRVISEASDVLRGL